MSVSFHHDCPCSFCGVKPIDREGLTSGDRGCDRCSTLYFVCGHCRGQPCPECGGPLKKKGDLFPHNLFRAIRRGDVDEVRRVLYALPSNIYEIVDEQGTPPLIAAAIDHQLEICKILVEEHAVFRSQSDKYGRTALIEMVRLRGGKWNRSIADFFASTVNHCDNDGRTALMFAAQGAGAFGAKRGNVGIAQQLIDMGADVSVVDKRGLTALGWAMQSNKASKTSNNEEMVDFLTKRMVAQIAYQEFHQRYDYRVTEKGALALRSKQP
jgi:hypothetical protein